MRKSKEKNQGSHSKPKKKIREINSYKIQFKTKVKQKSNLNSKEKDKIQKSNNKYSQSNLSIKTYNQKPSSSLIKEYNSNPQLNNNAISYSNYAFSELEQSKKSDNIIFKSSKIKNEDYNTFLCSNNKLNINDLNITNNKNISLIEKDNNKNIQINNKNDNFSKITFPKKAAKSMFNENEKNYENLSYNLSHNIKNYKYETSLKRLDEKLKSNLEKKNIKKLNLEEDNINYKKNKNDLGQYINSNTNSFKTLENNYNKINEIKNDNLNLNNEVNNQNNNLQYQRGNKLEEINNRLNFIYNSNLNGQEININPTYEKNINSIEQDNITDNNNFEIYQDLEEKLKKLHFKIHKNSSENQSKIPQSIDNPQKYENQLTYPNLKRYRQKSEPSLRINKYDPDYNNLTANSNLIRRKKSDKKISDPIPPHLIIKFPLGGNTNKNLENLKLLEENLKTESNTKKMIDILLSQQNNPELKNILTELQMTIKKLQKDEDKNGDISLTTQPVNYFFPFGITIIENIKNLKNNSKFDACDDISQINRNRKIEKLKSKLNEFQEIINKTPKIKNYLNIQPKNINLNNFDYDKNQKVYTNLCPVNNFENGLFSLEK